MKCCGWYPDYLVRLFHKERTNFVDSKQHASVPTDNTLKLNADIEHYSYQNIGELFAKPGRNFSGRSAKIMYENGKKVNAFAPFSHAIWTFIRGYFFRKGIFYGLDGLTISLASSCAVYLKYAKLIEYQRDPKVREAEDFDEVW